MASEETRESSIVKPGKGAHIFFAFVGRARPQAERPTLSSKSSPRHQWLALLLIMLVACMMAVVLWRHAF